MDLIAVGDVMVDVHVRAPALKRGGDVHGRVRLQPAGTSANAAVWAAWDGGSARVLGRVGDDLAGRLLRDALAERGVDAALTVDADASSGTMLVVVEAGERSMVADRGANAALRPDDLPASLDAGAVLVSGYLLLQEPTTPAGLAAVDRAKATFVAVETSSWPLVEAFGPERFLSETTNAGANVLLANEREAEILIGVSSTAAARALGERYRVACVKLGEKGAAMSFDGIARGGGRGTRRRGRRDGRGRRVRRCVARRARARRRSGSRAPARVPCRSPRRLQRRDLAAGGPAVSDAFVVTEDVLAALADGRGVVALETSVIGQGLPVPRNRECIERMSAAIRASDAVPAWIGVVDGSVTVGLSDAQLDRFTEPGAATKVARRDYPLAMAAGELGATTVSATIWAAAKAGIVVSATGGIGGVHPGNDPDVSADLFELARTPGLLVCSGPKSIIDPAATAEKLEELGVALVGYGVDRLPFFLAREAPVDLEHRVDTPDEAAAVARAVMDLRAPSTVLLCNAIPEASRDGPRRGRGRGDRGRSSCRARRRARQGTHAVPPGRARRAHGRPEPRSEPGPAGGQRARRGTDRRRAQRSQVWMMTLEKFQPYLSDFGFFDLPPARARIVIGTSTIRAWCRSASIRISLVQN